MSNDHHTYGQQDEQRNVIENSGSIAIAGIAEMILQMNMIHVTEEDLSLISAFRPVIISRIEHRFLCRQAQRNHHKTNDG